MVSLRSLWLVFVLGAPGAGKSTLAARLARRYRWRHLSVGELLRQAAAAAENCHWITPSQSRELKTLLASGDRIAPSDVTVRLLTDALPLGSTVLATAATERVVIDGFPRNQENWETFKTIIQAARTTTISYAFIWLELPFAIARERALKRHRDDDLDQTIKQRFAVYERETLPLQKLLPAERLFCISANQESDQIEATAARQLSALGVPVDDKLLP